MIANRIGIMAATGLMVVMACMIPPRSGAQVARRVASVRDGKVRMTFAARDGLCGFNNGISTNNNDDSRTSSWSSSSRSEDVAYDVDCSDGPVRLVVTMSGGNPSRIKTYVGGQWRSASGVTDIGNLSVRDAAEYLLDVANNSSGKVAGEAIFPLTIADSIDASRPLYTLAKNQSKSRDARDQAIFWLSQVEDEKAVGMLEDILKTSREDWVADKAIFGLSQHRSGKGFPVLKSYAQDESKSDDIRGKAIFWLGQRKSDIGENYLRGLYSTVRSSELKDKIIFSVSQQKAPGNDQWLLDLVSNSSEPIEMRKKALFWAGQGGAPLAKLTALYSKMNNREMKDQMIFVFSQRRERAALDKLMDIARSDPDRDARKKAMFWLGQSKDSRVAAFLSDVINR